MKSLIIITHGYPCEESPSWFPFTRQFAHAAARSGAEVTVIAPVPHNVSGSNLVPEYKTEFSNGKVAVQVFRPRYISASAIQFGRWNTAQIGLKSFCAAVRRVLRHDIRERADVLYGHFLYLGGAAAVKLGAEFGIPAFPMVGDGMLNSMEPFGSSRARRHFATAAGFMTNSSFLGHLLQRDLGIAPDRIGVFPNGVDHRMFYPRNKREMRQKFNLPDDQLLVICAAKQDNQKGPSRVGEAIRGLPGVSGIFLGTGSNPPQADNILFNQSVPHHLVAEWLSAADLFVLPSTFEGCCNAMVEAMACGLPVIGAQGEFNDDILNERVAVRVDPLDIHAIRDAITCLRDDPNRRIRMSQAAREWSLGFDVEQRAQRMLMFMSERCHGVKGGRGGPCSVSPL
ncbi:MAG: glycosyltransferase [bacterium]